MTNECIISNSLEPIRKRRVTFNCVSLLWHATSPPRFFPLSLLVSFHVNIIIPLFPRRNVDTAHCPRATLGTKRWINTPLNKQLLSALRSSFLSFFLSFSPPLPFPLFTFFSLVSSGKSEGERSQPRERARFVLQLEDRRRVSRYTQEPGSRNSRTRPR